MSSGGVERGRVVPMWTQTTHTPASLIVNQASTTPASFRALATPSGWADSAFFEVFGPKQGRCGNFRWGKQWDVSKGIPGPLPPGDKCRNTEYPVDRKDGLCWKNSAGDKCGDWCVQNMALETYYTFSADTLKAEIASGKYSGLRHFINQHCTKVQL